MNLAVLTKDISVNGQITISEVLSQKTLSEEGMQLFSAFFFLLFYSV